MCRLIVWEREGGGLLWGENDHCSIEYNKVCMFDCLHVVAVCAVFDWLQPRLDCSVGQQGEQDWADLQCHTGEWSVRWGPGHLCWGKWVGVYSVSFSCEGVYVLLFEVSLAECTNLYWVRVIWYKSIFCRCKDNRCWHAFNFFLILRQSLVIVAY